MEKEKRKEKNLVNQGQNHPKDISWKIHNSLIHFLILQDEVEICLISHPGKAIIIIIIIHILNSCSSFTSWSNRTWLAGRNFLHKSFFWKIDSMPCAPKIYITECIFVLKWITYWTNHWQMFHLCFWFLFLSKQHWSVCIDLSLLVALSVVPQPNQTHLLVKLIHHLISWSYLFPDFITVKDRMNSCCHIGSTMTAVDFFKANEPQDQFPIHRLIRQSHDVMCSECKIGIVGFWCPGIEGDWNKTRYSLDKHEKIFLFEKTRCIWRNVADVNDALFGLFNYLFVDFCLVGYIIVLCCWTLIFEKDTKRFLLDNLERLEENQ